MASEGTYLADRWGSEAAAAEVSIAPYSCYKEERRHLEAEHGTWGVFIITFQWLDMDLGVGIESYVYISTYIHLAAAVQTKARNRWCQHKMWRYGEPASTDWRRRRSLISGRLIIYYVPLLNLSARRESERCVQVSEKRDHSPRLQGRGVINVPHLFWDKYNSPWKSEHWGGSLEQETILIIKDR